MHVRQDFELQAGNITCRQNIHAGQAFPLDINNTYSQNMHAGEISLLSCKKYYLQPKHMVDRLCF